MPSLRETPQTQRVVTLRTCRACRGRPSVVCPKLTARQISLQFECGCVTAGAAVDFDFSPAQVAFADEVDRFLDEHDDPEIFDLTRENMAQIVDTPKRRAFMRQLGEQGWLGLTWPK